jgi:hypothetical protein
MDRKTEIQKDRKTERQKDRKTERQKDRTKRQKDRKTERQKHVVYISANLDVKLKHATISLGEENTKLNCLIFQVKGEPKEGSR